MRDVSFPSWKPFINSVPPRLHIIIIIHYTFNYCFQCHLIYDSLWWHLYSYSCISGTARRFQGLGFAGKLPSRSILIQSY